MHSLLKQGHSIAVHVGGIAEMFETYPDREVIYLSKRRGFLRAAAEHGVAVLPMYHFGNTQILSFFPRCVHHPASVRLPVAHGASRPYEFGVHSPTVGGADRSSWSKSRASRGPRAV